MTNHVVLVPIVSAMDATKARIQMELDTANKLGERLVSTSYVEAWICLFFEDADVII